MGHGGCLVEQAGYAKQSSPNMGY